MPVLENHRHENFCRAYIENGRNQAEAYRTAFDNPALTPGSCRTLAYKLSRRPEIFERITELEVRRVSAIEQVQKVAEEYCLEVIEFLIDTMRDDDTPRAVRMRAGEVILERGLGKPLQQVTINQRVSYVIEAPSVAADFEAWALAAEPVRMIEAIDAKAPDHHSQ